MPEVGGGGLEEPLVKRLRQSPPEYIVLISLDTAEHGIKQYGAPGNPGYLLVQWAYENYAPIASWGEPFSGTKLKGARILRRKTL
jgi:hypothetical protein